MAIERFSQGGVQGVHRAVALGHLVPHLAADAELDGGLGRGVAVAVGFDVDVVVQQLEVRLERAGGPLHQQVERGLGRLELVAAVLQLDDLAASTCSISARVVLQVVLAWSGRRCSTGRRARSPARGARCRPSRARCARSCCAARLTACTCMPPLWANALGPTNGWLVRKCMLAIS